jgi:hypothetical protein
MPSQPPPEDLTLTYKREELLPRPPVEKDGPAHLGGPWEHTKGFRGMTCRIFPLLMHCAKRMHATATGVVCPVDGVSILELTWHDPCACRWINPGKKG